MTIATDLSVLSRSGRSALPVVARVAVPAEQVTVLHGVWMVATFAALTEQSLATAAVKAAGSPSRVPEVGCRTTVPDALFC